MTLVFVVITVIGFALFVIVPAVIFYALEDWTFGEAVYCCFVTVLTIGWADFVPGIYTRGTYTGDRDLSPWMFLCMIFVLQYDFSQRRNES